MVNLIVGIFGVLIANLAIILGSLVLFGIVGNLQSFLPRAIVTPVMIALSAAVLAISLTQLLYVIPWLRKLNHQHKPETAKGVIIGAIITALLNGGCWILFMNMW